MVMVTFWKLALEKMTKATSIEWFPLVLLVIPMVIPVPSPEKNNKPISTIHVGKYTIMVDFYGKCR